MLFQDYMVIGLAAVIALSGIFINYFRPQEKAKKHFTLETDRTLLVFRLLIPLGIILGLIFHFLRFGHYTTPTLWIGVLLVGIGLLIRWVAIQSLGQAFQVQVSIVEQQQLITEGIFKYIRHPSYSGLLLYYLGLGLAMQNGYALAALMFCALIAVLLRIPVEEKVLVQHFGEQYQKYCRHSWRLIPWLY
jgi:protein-S-isoprenylcysteine O-methyltransferase